MNIDKSWQIVIDRLFLDREKICRQEMTINKKKMVFSNECDFFIGDLRIILTEDKISFVV